MPIAVERRGRIASITFNRPETGNLMNATLFAALRDALREVAADDVVRVVRLGSTGDAFTRGGDLHEFMHNPLKDGWERSALYDCTLELARFPKPIVAAVQGPAIGGGSTLILNCDIVVASDRAGFVFPFSSLGICPEIGSSYLLPLAVGERRARDWMLTSRRISAEEARDAGLITELVPHEQLNARADAIAEQLAGYSGAAMGATKKLLQEVHLAALEAAIQAEMRALSALMEGPAVKEAVGAFFDKRKPDFSTVA
ncbi:enoyl-CoA hydratase-related protein (plasmid) [Tistrella bauzanensis]|uniref:enoyl-CoA hydratase/isomerase family protein n=1 Tax=Tistrella TaxID=171436 RepID=UPI0031F6F09E